MCVNDILCQGAKPLFFLDYIGTGKLEPEKMASVVEGVANGCVKGEMALIGGETAEMPGFYEDGEYDIAGFAVGVVERDEIIDGSKIKEGDVILGLASSGLHSNGFSLVRKIVFERENLDLDEHYGLDRTLGEELLTPTRIYVKSVRPVIEETDVHGIVHITGGGIYENVPRILPKGLTAKLDYTGVERTKIFDAIAEWGKIETKEMYNTFNMGIGMMLFLDEKDVPKARQLMEERGETVYELGRVVKGEELEVCL